MLAIQLSMYAQLGFDNGMTTLFQLLIILFYLTVYYISFGIMYQDCLIVYKVYHGIDNSNQSPAH